ncbi:PH domain-containing protein [Sphingomonas sp. LY160]|uniref:PH domain-containing protein n=1 Tax=Sphingomonas sp. LY160 TaxID=3095342 RepID=UPI002ADECE98|nr:PH domain-containing protein [Sphingomonas sp. LY160]MEA1072782.1 PH domain-containing protein [Sphingomonas sp. LY160]
MSEAAALPVDRAALGPPERLHPLFLLTGLGKAFKGAWGMIAGGAVLAAQGYWWTVLALAVGMPLYSLIALYLRWRRLEYRVGADELRIDSGLLSRTSRAIPFDRVTDVDLEQGPIHRLFGLARVRFETGASAGAAAEDGVLDTISLERAEALRDFIRARRTGHAVSPTAVLADVPAEVETPVFAMDSKRVLTAGLFNFSLAVLAGLFGVTQTFGDVLGFDPFKRTFWLMVADRAGPLRDVIMAHQIVAIIGGAVLLIALGVATGTIRTVLREHGFRLDRTVNGLRRRRGLLTLTDVTIPARRVQAAILATGPIRRRFGWRVLKLQSLAMDGGKGDHVVAPLAHEEEASKVLHSLDWPIAPAEGNWHRVSRAHVTAFAAMMAPAIAVAVVAAILLQPLILIAILGAGIAILVRWLEWRRTRFALSDDVLFVETGWWQQRRRILPLRKIQSVDIAESGWSRLFGFCTLRLGVAGGGGFSGHEIPSLPRSGAIDLRHRLLAKA